MTGRTAPLQAPTSRRSSPTSDAGAPDPHPLRRLLGEILRFLAVGGLATAVSLVGFNALVHGTLAGAAPLHDQPVAAHVLGNVLAGVVAYAGMRVWAFGQRDAGDPVQGMVRFFALGAATMVIRPSAVSRYVLGLGSVARFGLFRCYVFLDAAAPLPGPGPA